MNRTLLTAAVAAAVPLCAGTALASPCGDKSAAMLRSYNATAPANTSPQAGDGGLSSANSSRPGAVPITTEQRLKIAHLVVKANSEAKAGDETACDADVRSANAIIHGG